MAAVSDFDQLHPHTPVAAAAEAKTIRTEADIDVHAGTADDIRNEMRRMTPAERLLVTQSMTGAPKTDGLPSVTAEYDRKGDVAALNFETANHEKLTVDLRDKPGEPHLNTKEQLLLNGVTRAITTDEHGKVFSVDDSDGGAIRSNPRGGANAYIRINPNGTRDRIEDVAVTPHGAIAYTMQGEDGRTVEKVNAKGDVISEISRNGRPMTSIVAHKDGNSDLNASMTGTHGTQVDVQLQVQLGAKVQEEKRASLTIKYPDGRMVNYAAGLQTPPGATPAQIRQQREADKAFTEAYQLATDHGTFDVSSWVAAHPQWLVPPKGR